MSVASGTGEVQSATLRRPAALEWLKANPQLLLLTMFIVIGALVRMVDITSIPKGFFADEAAYGLNADLILHTGKDEYGATLPFFFRSFNDYKLPLFIYTEVPFMAVFGRTEFAVRFTSAVLGTLTIGMVYLLAKEIFRRELAALTAAATLAILPWHIHYSRTGFGEIVIFPLMFCVAFYLFFRAIRRNDSLILPAVAFALCFFTYRAAWPVMPPLLLVTAVLYRREILGNQRNKIAAAVFAAMMLPIVFHFFLSDSGDRASQVSILNNHQKPLLELFSQFYRSYFTDGFLFQRGDNDAIVRHYFPGHGWLYWWQLPLVILGVVAMAARPNRRYALLLAALFVFPLAGAVTETSPISSRTLVGAVVFSLFTGAGLTVVADYLRASGRPQFITPALGALGVVAAVMFVAYFAAYRADYPKDADGYWGWQDGPQEIIAHFLEVQDDYDELYMDGTFNIPTVFFPFYAHNRCSKCTTGADERYDPKKKQLFALRPETLDKITLKYESLGSIRNAKGGVEFVYVEFRGR